MSCICALYFISYKCAVKSKSCFLGYNLTVFLYSAFQCIYFLLSYLNEYDVLFQVCNIGTLGFAINVRYDSVFGNSDIEALLSKFRIADHTFTRALNLFSIAVVTFSATSIAVIIFAFFSIASLKWKRMFVLIVSAKKAKILWTNLKKVTLKKKNHTKTIYTMNYHIQIT